MMSKLIDRSNILQTSTKLACVYIVQNIYDYISIRPTIFFNHYPLIMCVTSGARGNDKCVKPRYSYKSECLLLFFTGPPFPAQLSFSRRTRHKCTYVITCGKKGKQVGLGALIKASFTHSLLQQWIHGQSRSKVVVKNSHQGAKGEHGITTEYIILHSAITVMHTHLKSCSFRASISSVHCRHFRGRDRLGEHILLL